MFQLLLIGHISQPTREGREGGRREGKGREEGREGRREGKGGREGGGKEGGGKGEAKGKVYVPKLHMYIATSISRRLFSFPEIAV